MNTESTRDALAKWLARHDNKYAWSKMTRGEKNEQVDFTKYTSGYKELISLFNTHLDQQIAEAKKDSFKLAKEDVMKLRTMYLTKDYEDPIGEKVVAIRNKLRDEIATDIEERIATLTKQDKEK